MLSAEISVDSNMQELITPGSLGEGSVESVDQLEVFTQFVPWKIEPKLSYLPGFISLLHLPMKINIR